LLIESTGAKCVPINIVQVMFCVEKVYLPYAERKTRREPPIDPAAHGCCEIGVRD